MAKLPVVFIIGASGQVGTATTKALSEKYGGKVKIRAGVRDPNVDKADSLKALSNVSLVKATMGADKLEETFKDVDALFIVTPPTEDRAELVTKTARSAKASGVKYILALSVEGASEMSDTPFGKQFTEIETNVRELGVPYGIVRLPYFLDNIFMVKESIQKHQKLSGWPIKEDKPMSAIHPKDAGLACASLLVDYENHNGKIYNLISHRLSVGEIAREFSSALGKEIEVETMTYDESRRILASIGLPQWRIDGFIAFCEQVNTQSPALNTTDLSDLERLSGEKPTTLKDYTIAVAPAFM